MRVSSQSFLALVALAAPFGAVRPAAAQVPVTQFIANVESTIANVTAGLKPVSGTLIFGGQNIFAYGSAVPNWNPQIEIDYVDGLHASGVQRVEFNPAVTTINNPTAVVNLDAMVMRTRQLGMLLAINPEFLVNEFQVTTFQDFVDMARQTYPALAARYKPDNFVIVHEPTTQTARMAITVTPAEWVTFVETLEPLIKAASPHTQVGAGDCSHCNEDAYFTAFAAIPTCNATNLQSGCIDFLTMDLYSDTTNDFTEDQNWAALAHASNKSVYMEETFAPHYLGPPPAGGYQSNPGGAEAYTLIGGCNLIFAPMDAAWLAGMQQFDMANGMTAMTTFTTQAFFLYVTSGPDKATDPAYLREMAAALQNGQLTSLSSSYRAQSAQYGPKSVTSVSNASYATLPSIFNPNCGSAANPCYANSTVAPDMIVSAFGADLAKETAQASTWPLSLGNTTATIVDSTNTTFPVPLYSVAPTQANYLVPSGVAPGPATLSITSGDGTVTNGIVLVAPIAPGLYTTTADGKGAAAAIAVCSGTCSDWPNPMGNGQYWQYTFPANCTTGNCSTPLNWGSNDTLVIELYGTGIRHLALTTDITASANGVDLPVKFVGAQGTDQGLDQVNVLIPSALHGAGQIAITLTAQDKVNNVTVTSNPVTINLQ